MLVHMEQSFSKENSASSFPSQLPTPSYDGNPWFLTQCGNEHPYQLLYTNQCTGEVFSKGHIEGDCCQLNLVDESLTTKLEENRTDRNAASKPKDMIDAVEDIPNGFKENTGPEVSKHLLVPPTEMRFQAMQNRGYRKTRRTKTSYDSTTRYQLNSLFYETFGNSRKPTKDERRRLLNRTGITSRCLTYWLSNHKRRFSAHINAYKRLVAEGEINSYDSFILYCNKHHIPELGAHQIHCDDMISENDKSKGTFTGDAMDMLLSDEEE